MRRTVPLWMALALLLAVPSDGIGQDRYEVMRQRVADTYTALDMQTALASVRAGHGGKARIFLTQEGVRRPRPQLDASADSLVVIATTSYDPDDRARGRRARRAAHGALQSAGYPEVLAGRSQYTAEWQLPPPIAYPLALDKLLLVFERLPLSSERNGMLGRLTRLPDTARVVAFLGDVARREDSAARAAVGYLYRDMDAAGLATLRRLFQTDAVTDRTARSHLRAIAVSEGWVPLGIERDRKDGYS